MEDKKLKKFTVKEFIKSEVSANRLQSIRLPRDLSLGGTKIKKKAYTPNLSVARNKDKTKEILKNEFKQKKKNYEKPNRQKNDKPRFIQSTGVFSEGIGSGDIARTSLVLEKKIQSKDFENSQRIKTPTISFKAKAINKVAEDCVMDEIMRESDEDESEKIGEKLPFAPINWCADELKKKENDKLKEESLYLEQDLRHLSVDSSYFNVLPREYDQKSGTESKPKLTLWQLPNTFPFKKDSNDTKDKKLHDCKLNEMPEGKIGNILVRKSGKIEVYIGDIKYELESTQLESFSEEIVAIDSEKHTAAVIGEIEKRFLINPDWESFLK